MSEIFLDTETTGLSFKEGHKIVEIACIETNDLIPTGKIFHKLINPQRDVPDEAFKVHGFSSDFLKDKETFNEIADEFLNFIKEKKITSTFLLIVKKLFKEADDVLNIPLSKFILEGPQDKLDLTANTQPAILTVSYSIFKVMSDEFGFNIKNFK